MEQKPHSKAPDAHRTEAATGFMALQFDAAEFAHYVADFDLTEAQQNQLLETLWVIMVGFVDLGFHIHPVQQAPERGSDKALPYAYAEVLESVHSVSNSKTGSTKAHLRESREG